MQINFEATAVFVQTLLKCLVDTQTSDCARHIPFAKARGQAKAAVAHTKFRTIAPRSDFSSHIFQKSLIEIYVNKKAVL